MKRTHRTMHTLIWFILLPMLLGFIYMASKDGSTSVPTMNTVPHASEAGEFP